MLPTILIHIFPVFWVYEEYSYSLRGELRELKSEYFDYLLTYITCFKTYENILLNKKTIILK